MDASALRRSGRRRALLIGAGALLAAPLVVSAQQPATGAKKKSYRVAFIAGTTPVARLKGGPDRDPTAQMFVRRLGELGYVEGRNLQLDFYSLEGKDEHASKILGEVVALKTDAILNVRQIVVEKYLAETAGIPVVTLATWNIVGTAAVRSLARPGGTVTGFIFDVDEQVEAKRLEFLREALPRVKRIAYLGERQLWDSPAGRNVRNAAQRLGLIVVHAELGGEGNLQAASAAIDKESPDAVYVPTGTATFAYRQRIGEFVATRRLPSIAAFRENAEAGCLMSYGVDVKEMMARAAGYVAKILGGAKAGELAVQQPEKFEIVINLRAAKALGVTVPKSVLLRADQVIE